MKQDTDNRTGKKLTQAEQILNYMKTGHTITTLEALNFFRCFRLASRISELRAEGHPIVTDMISTQHSGKMVARYRLANVHAQTSIDLEPINAKPPGVLVASEFSEEFINGFIKEWKS